MALPYLLLCCLTAFGQPQPLRVFTTDANGVAVWLQLPLTNGLVAYIASISSNNVYASSNGLLVSIIGSNAIAVAFADALANPTNTATASYPSGAIASTGWTNTWTNSLVVTYRGTNVSGWKKRAGALTSTNISYGVNANGTVILKPGQAIVLSGTGVTGSYDP